ncbi:hypothetical protein BC624_10915 [Flavobacterium granuli]|uniref:Uncharacterized protein n=1 Tax=Flavobacterium granuli TaxID=280093 RepID=A0A1M5S086_9FLAO|nr:hypothetical protein BC624_10915 [Flavobacterium granuli]SHH31811.1 hypothetical protein SAMN05443373_11115 [Flavobacterium granuli]
MKNCSFKPRTGQIKCFYEIDIKKQGVKNIAIKNLL